MKKTVSLLLAFAFMLSLAACGSADEDTGIPAASDAPASIPLAATPGTDTGYPDVPADAPYAEAVIWCREHSLMMGDDKGLFDPNGTLDRQTMATVIYRAEGQPAVSGEPRFTDVPAGVWYSDAVVWADSAKVMQGYGAEFGATDAISQEMMQVVLDRYLGRGDTWVGDPDLAGPATRAEIAVALMAALKDKLNVPETTAPEVTPTPKPENKKVLVAYFSCTNTTKGAAEKLAKAAGGDLFEIIPETPYAEADLNYHNDGCRANQEQKDGKARPAIASGCVIEDWDSYDVVFLGHPIWWGIPPKIMRTFCEQYDWTGKAVVGFCTSGGSRYSNEGLPELTQGANWLDTRRLNGTSQSDIDQWVRGLELEQKEDEPMENQINVSFNGHTYTATLADNPTAEAFVELIRERGGALTVSASDYGGWEKVAPLGTSLPANNQRTTTSAGDFVLYSGNQIVLFYGSNSWSYTRLGKLDGDLSNLKSDLGGGDVSITYALS